MEQEPGTKISPDRLSPEALHGIIEEFVTRDGTDMVEGETKVREVLDLLERGEVEIWFDETTRTCNIVVVHE
ncbi:MAG: YheU family protein [bacterium]|nr:YheU family protein [bacterium]